MDEFIGTAPELIGLFKIYAPTAADENLQQTHLQYSKGMVWEVWRKNKLVQIDFFHRWTNHSLGKPNRRNIEENKHASDSGRIHDTEWFQKAIHFFKSLDIANINLEVDIYIREHMNSGKM